MSILYGIKEIKTTTTIEAANELLKKGWILLGVFTQTIQGVPSCTFLIGLHAGRVLQERADQVQRMDGHRQDVP